MPVIVMFDPVSLGAGWTLHTGNVSGARRAPMEAKQFGPGIVLHRHTRNRFVS